MLNSILNELKKSQKEYDSLIASKRILEDKFSEIFKNIKDWKLIILGIITNGKGLYDYTPEELFENLIPEIRNIKFYGEDKISFDIRLVGKISDFPKTWINTGIFDITKLESRKPVDIDGLKSIVERKQKRISDYKKEQDNIQELIDEENSDITNIENWIKFSK